MCRLSANLLALDDVSSCHPFLVAILAYDLNLDVQGNLSDRAKCFLPGAIRRTYSASSAAGKRMLQIRKAKYTNLVTLLHSLSGKRC